MLAAPQQPRLFIIGYARAYRMELCEAFREQGFRATGYADMRLAAYAIKHTPPDLVLTDWLGGVELDTFGFVERFGGLMPVLVHTAHDVLFDVVRTLRAGAADYIRQPCFFPELLARLERAQSDVPARQTVSVGPLSLEVTTGVLSIAQDRIQLTERETRILATLLRCPDHPVGREKLMHAAAINRAKPTIIESYIKQLRKKHALLRVSLKTKYGKGYVFAMTGQNAQKLI